MEIGEEPVGAVCRARKASLVILASDAASNSIRRAAHFGEAGNVLQVPIPLTKAEMGTALGRSTCAMAAFTDVGMAAALVKKLAATDPEPYAAAQEALGQRAARVLQRQKEKRAHEKNLLRGKKKPWSFSPDQNKP